MENKTTANLFADILKTGCDRKSAAMALQVYKDLIEVKKYHTVKHNYCEELNCVYLEARKTKTSDEIIFVPISTSISFSDMNKYIHLSKNDSKRIFIAFTVPDSTCIYYEIANKLLEPPLETEEKSKDRVAIKMSVLSKNRKLLESAAMYGLPITLPKPTQVSQPDAAEDEN